MKYLLILIVSLVALDSYSQCVNPAPSLSNICEKGKGIKTNPQNPINCEDTSMKNTFDWKIKSTNLATPEYYDIWYYTQNSTKRIVENPFKAYTNAFYSDFVSFNNNSNYYSEDGWELMKVEFGKPATGPGSVGSVNPKLPYIMLYNKYTGTLRFFGTIIDPNYVFNTAEITLSIPRAPIDGGPITNHDSLKATNLLSIKGATMQPLDQQTKDEIQTIYVKYANDERIFFWFDVPLAYDPCICQFKSQFNVDFDFVQEAEVEISGLLEGSITTKTSGNTSYGDLVFSRVMAATVAGTVAYTSGGAIINTKAFIDLVDLYTKHPNKTQKEKNEANDLKGYLNCSGKFFDVLYGNYKDAIGTDEKKQIDAGKKLVDANTTFYNSLSKECKENDQGATAMSGNITAIGTVTSRFPLPSGKILLAIPGSNWTGDNVQDRMYLNSQNKKIPAYPTYNERLGTFALLKTPKMLFDFNTQTYVNRIHTNNFNQETFYKKRNDEYNFKLKDNFEFTFNPVLNLNKNKTKIMVRMVVGSVADNNITNTFVGIGKTVIRERLNFEYNPNNLYKLVSPYFDINDFKNINFRFIADGLEFKGNDWPGIHDINVEDTCFLQFSIDGESFDIGKDGNPNKFYQILTFPIKLEDATDNSLINVKTGNYVQGVQEFKTDTTLGNDSMLFFEGPVIINAKMQTTTGKKVKIFSLKGFELEPGAEILPTLELIPGAHVPKAPQPEATFASVAAFCTNTNQYKANQFGNAPPPLDPVQEKENKEALALKLLLQPNPANNEVQIVVLNKTEENVQLDVFDMQGRKVYSQTLGHVLPEFRTPISTASWNNGLYLIKITEQNSKHSSIQKLVVNHQ